MEGHCAVELLAPQTFIYLFIYLFINHLQQNIKNIL